MTAREFHAKSVSLTHRDEFIFQVCRENRAAHGLLNNLYAILAVETFSGRIHLD